VDPEGYERFTRDLEKRLQADPRVLGLVVLGSTARRDHLPDEWSDHDFFVVVLPGAQEAFRSDLHWLPRDDEIAFSFRETAHGLKVVFRDGHLIEFAVFDPDELAVARINRYRVLFDRERIGERLDRVAQVTTAVAPPTDEWLIGQFLTSLLVGVGRHRRGERLAGRHLVANNAVAHLVVLLTRYVGSSQTAKLDSLDPLRRFESVFPSLGRRLDAALRRETPAGARALLDIALRELPGRIPAAAVTAVRRRLAATSVAE
jgi:predicted nucleotidyltransferase